MSVNKKGRRKQYKADGSIRPSVLKRRKERTKRRNKTHRNIAMERLLQGCIDCAREDPISPWRYCLDALTFDHVPERGEKLYSIGPGKVHMITREKLMIELDKCDVVCANHHKVRTKEREKSCQYI